MFLDVTSYPKMHMHVLLTDLSNCELLVLQKIITVQR